MITRILLGLLLCGLQFNALATVVYAERGDAGGFSAPQDVVGTSIERIQGSIGGSDTIDAFRFYFAGGSLAILARLDDSGDDPAGILSIALISEQGQPGDSCFAGVPGNPDYPPNPCVANDWLDFSADGLAAGNYILGVCASTDVCLAEDPPFTIHFMLEPDLGATSARIGAPIPEPTALALIALGLLVMGITTSAHARRQTGAEAASACAGAAAQ
jgi:hypothetical protein